MNFISQHRLSRLWPLACSAVVCLAGLAACGSGGDDPAPPGPAPVQLLPAITQQPQTQVAHQGDSPTFSVAASGAAPLSYQWTRNGVPIEGATGASYTVGEVNAVDSSDVLRVNVKNASGSVQSTKAVLLVDGAGVRALAGPVGKAFRSTDVGFEAASGIALLPDGGGYMSSGAKVYKVARDGQVSILLTAPACAFKGGAVDKDGNYYTACGSGLYKVAPSGNVLPTPLAASSGSALSNVAVNASGLVYVADVQNKLYSINPQGKLELLAGGAERGEGTGDGVGAMARFNAVAALAVDPRGDLVVIDDNAVRKVSAAGAVQTLAGARDEGGWKDGAGAQARFSKPLGVAVDAAGTIYVADTGNKRIRKIAPGGEVSTVAGSGGEYRYEDGLGKEAGFFLPAASALDGTGNLIVSDTDTLRMVTPEGRVSTFAGVRPAQRAMTWLDGTGREARFNMLGGIALDAAGNLLVADSRNHAIRKVGAAGEVTTLLGAPHKFGSVDGPLASAGLYYPREVAAGANGTLYVLDGNYPGQTPILRKLGADGIVSTVALAASPLDPRASDGAALTAQLQKIAADAAGNLYVASVFSEWPQHCPPVGPCKSSAVLRKIAADGRVTNLLSKENSPVAYENTSGLTLDKAGNVYVRIDETILRINPAGKVTTLLGADPAGRRSINAMAVDAGGNVYFSTSDPITFNGASDTVAGKWPAGALGKVTPDGVVSVAVYPSPSNPRLDPLLSWLAEARDMVIDADGTLYVSKLFGIVKMKLP